MNDFLTRKSLDYHAHPQPGKIAVQVTKPANTADDLSLAYSPGVAAPVLEIAADAKQAYRYTNKANSVAVVSNGSAILGLGNLGALASKPVMEGKAVLFKRFANIDAFDIEVDTANIDDFITTVRNIANTFGGINLEDIKAPECFAIEKALIQQCRVPIFHDDQHGTAIVTVAGLLNALEVQQKKLSSVRIVCLGAGAAAIATLNLLLELGVKKEQIILLDSKGVVHKDRPDLADYKNPFANATDKRTLRESCRDADIFLGFAVGNLLSVEHLQLMSPNPIIFAAANPDPEIKPELAHATRKDLIVATGRSDYPNQVNNVLAFPFLFRGALDVHAREINLPMKLAAMHAIKDLAHEEIPIEVSNAYRKKNFCFGRDYILPKPVDPRLLNRIAPAVAEAAITSGAAEKDRFA